MQLSKRDPDTPADKGLNISLEALVRGGIWITLGQLHLPPPILHRYLRIDPFARRWPGFQPSGPEWPGESKLGPEVLRGQRRHQTTRSLWPPEASAQPRCVGQL